VELALIQRLVRLNVGLVKNEWNSVYIDFLDEQYANHICHQNLTDEAA
jgi:hypothetical protein